MFLDLNPSAEPLSPRYRDQPSILADSYAYNVILRELDEYSRGYVGGRSFLIAGHRGSGKTTLVHKAIQDLARRYREEIQPYRLLTVPLHGPSLLNEAISEQRVENNSQSKGESDDPPENGGSQEAVKDETKIQEHVLRQITIALYRALANEMSRAFRERILAGNPTGVRSSELPAQMQLELDSIPDPVLLRDLWERAGLLEKGVLFSESIDPDQGAREILALATAAQAFRVVSGQLGETVSKKSDAQLKQEGSTAKRDSEESGSSSLFSPAQVKELINLFIGVLAGAFVGLGALSETNAFVAGAAAILTTLLTSFGLNVTTSWSRTRVASKQYTFIREYSVATLSRELPVLVQRLRDAKIAPVFVIDELDKLLIPHTEIGYLVAYLKHFVTERTFTCFLTDRDYFEYLENLSLTKPYPKEHTYFTHRIFVLYKPNDLRNYLKEMVQDGSSPFLSDFELLTFVLLHQARMHPFDMRREFSKLIQHEVIQIPEYIRSDYGFRYSIMIQVAIEIILAEYDLEHRLNQDPNFGQFAYDALYFPSRSWAKGEALLDISKLAFEKYLAERLGSDLNTAKKKNDDRGGENRTTEQVTGGGVALEQNAALGISSVEGKNDGEDERVNFTVTGNDVSFLHEKVRELVGLLSSPDQIVTRLSQTDLSLSLAAPSDLVSAIPLPLRVEGEILQDLRLLEMIDQNTYRWRFDHYGRPLAREELSIEEAQLKTDIELVQDFEGFIKEFSSSLITPQSLAAEFYILARSPDWSSVQIAINRLQQYQETKEEYTDFETDKLQLRDYLNGLQERSPVLAEALALGRGIGSRAGIAELGPQLKKGLEALSQVLDLSGLVKTAEIEDAFRQIDVKFTDDARKAFTLEPGGFKTWRTRIQDATVEKISQVAQATTEGEQNANG
jgi:hypothetical protein